MLEGWRSVEGKVGTQRGVTAGKRYQPWAGDAEGTQDQCDAKAPAVELSCFSRNPGATLPGRSPCHRHPRLSLVLSLLPDTRHRGATGEEGRQLLLPASRLPCQRLLFPEPRWGPIGGRLGDTVCGASALNDTGQSKEEQECS